MCAARALELDITMYFEETMSREYLQGLVQMKKQADHARHIDEYVKKIAHKIGAAASTGAWH